MRVFNQIRDVRKEHEDKRTRGQEDKRTRDFFLVCTLTGSPFATFPGRDIGKIGLYRRSSVTGPDDEQPPMSTSLRPQEIRRHVRLSTITLNFVMLLQRNKGKSIDHSPAVHVDWETCLQNLAIKTFTWQHAGAKSHTLIDVLHLQRCLQSNMGAYQRKSWRHVQGVRG